LTLTVDSNTPLTETLGSNGTYVYTTSFATAGSHTIVAIYAGNSTYATSTGTVTVNVGVPSSGTGSIALAATPSSLSVAQGASGTETITVTPAGGYTGTVDLTFNTSNNTALQSLCYQFTTTNSAGVGTVAVSSAAAVATQLTLYTNSSECTGLSAAESGGKHSFRKLLGGGSAKNNGANPLPLGVAFAGLLLAGFLGRYARKFRALAAAIALLAVCAAVTACSGNISSTSTSTNVPAGTYTITIDGQDSSTASIAASTTFSLTIQ
jgi:hypothetical protein